MKKLFLLVLMIFAVALSYGQDGAIVKVDARGNIEPKQAVDGKTIVSKGGEWRISEVDGSTTNELQTLSWSAPNLSISSGNSVDISSIVSGYVTGSGTTGYVPYFTGASEIGNSGLYWNNSTGRFGIGTTNPAVALEVVGNNIRVSNGQQYEFGGISAAVTGSSANNNIKFVTSSIERLMINASGNVGIGQTSPTARLHVTGSGSTSATTALLVENSVGTDALTVKDDGTINAISTGYPLHNIKASRNPDNLGLNGGIRFSRTSSGTGGQILVVHDNNAVTLTNSNTNIANVGFFPDGAIGFGGANGQSLLNYSGFIGSSTQYALADGVLGSSLCHLITNNSNVTSGTRKLMTIAPANFSSTSGSPKLIGLEILNGGPGPSGSSTAETIMLQIRQDLSPNVNGTHYGVKDASRHVPTSGSSTFTAYNINSTINQTGGANGITRGLYINPTLTSAADWRGIEVNTPSISDVYIGKNTGSAAVDITSTAQGFLPPRMTDAQQNAISSPALGLQLVSTTDSTARFFNGTSWNTLLTDGMGYLNWSDTTVLATQYYVNTNLADTAAAIRGDFPVLDDGVYTPVGSDSSNVSTATIYQAQYSRNDSTVTVSGFITITPSGAGNCHYEFNPPFASDFTTPFVGCAGNFNDSDSHFSGSVRATPATDHIRIAFVAPDGSAHPISYHYTYRIQ